MPKFSNTSLQRLETCHPDIQRLMHEVIKHFDCTVIEGHRSQEEQDKAYYSGRSQIKWPHGKHNSYPSNAIDVIPWPIDWADRERMSLFAGYMLATATQLGINLRWGGDWDRDTQVKDNKFDDLVHFELV